MEKRFRKDGNIMDSNLGWLFIGGIVFFYAWKFLGPGRAASSKTVRAKLEAGATVIDVRTSGEFSSGAYPKARNIPLDTLASKLAKLGPKDAPIIVYCASGARSSQAARILKGAGFSDVTNAGGLHSMPR
jgi:phage shock protein E